MRTQRPKRGLPSQAPLISLPIMSSPLLTLNALTSKSARRRTDQRTDSFLILTRLLSFALWTHYFPVRTAERVFHIMFPDTKDHKVRLNQASDQDENIFRHMTFGLRDPHQTNPEDADFASYPPSLIIVVQPPWILAPRDLESFVNSRKVLMRLDPVP